MIAVIDAGNTKERSKWRKNEIIVIVIFDDFEILNLIKTDLSFI